MLRQYSSHNAGGSPKFYRNYHRTGVSPHFYDVYPVNCSAVTIVFPDCFVSTSYKRSVNNLYGKLHDNLRLPGPFCGLTAVM